MPTPEPLADLDLVDHHCHGIIDEALDRNGFENLITEGGPARRGATNFDTQLGFAITRWCAPLLGLDPHASPEAYLRRRDELGRVAVNTLLLRACGVGDILLDTGYESDKVMSPTQMAEAAGARGHEVVRLEAIAEHVARSGVSAKRFAAAYAEALDMAARNAVGLKSIIAYRYGLDFEPERPTESEVRVAADAWLAACEKSGRYRLDHPVVLRHVLWAGVDQHLPLQFHVGFGDRDIHMHRCDPTHMTDFIKSVQASDTAIMLLHCYPYHREAGYLAAVYPHVYMDVGLALNYVGARAETILAESLELTPFHKMLFSSDAFGLPELHYLGAHLFRRSLFRVLHGWVEDGSWSGAEAERVARLIGRDNARCVYQLDPA
jgi:uncharacterized protein